MAKILPFAKLDTAPGRSAKVGLRAAAGEIVIFPGIRVEYHDAPPTPTPTDRPTGRGRRGPAKKALSA